MGNKKEEWQNPDSGYLNCIGVGDTYVRKQMERILSSGNITTDICTQKNVIAQHGVYAGVPVGKPTDDNRLTDEDINELREELEKANRL